MVKERTATITGQSEEFRDEKKGERKRAKGSERRKRGKREEIEDEDEDEDEEQRGGSDDLVELRKKKRRRWSNRRKGKRGKADLRAERMTGRARDSEREATARGRRRVNLWRATHTDWMFSWLKWGLGVQGQLVTFLSVIGT